MWLVQLWQWTQQCCPPLLKAEEHIDVATFDIPIVFIQTLVEENDEHCDKITMKICGAMMNVLSQRQTKAIETVQPENG